MNLHRVRARSGLAAIAALTCLLEMLLPAAHAAGVDAAATNFLWLAVILLAANIAARAVERVHMPGVLGELLVGVVMGNLALAGISAFEPLRQDPIIAFIAELGVVILLFQIGLESSLKQMRQVGARAAAVAIVGIIAPFLLGALLVGPWLLPGHSVNSYLFLGATLTATSVGITGRVFQDLGKIATREAQIVLGAAVIDDVLGLVILAVVTSIVKEGSIDAAGVGLLVLEAAAFLVGAIVLGRVLAARLGRMLARVDAGVAMKLALILSLCLLLAWLAHAIGLAPIVGAFAAGLVLEPVFLSEFDDPPIVRELKPLVGSLKGDDAVHMKHVLDSYSGHHHQLLVTPLGFFFVPVFFVYTGMQVDLRSFFDPDTLLIGLGVTVAAFLGKVVAGYAAGAVSRAVVGWGMVPRGEVGLIFAMVGNQLGVMNQQMFSVIIIMVITTTLVTPLVLMRLLSRS
jgi:Kef-type K+ transport system membrane component KefB